MVIRATHADRLRGAGAETTIRPMPAEPTSATRSSNRRAACGMALLVAIFVCLCTAAEWHKSITEDELVYTIAGYINLHAGDFRMSPEHPPLWRMWAALDTLDLPLKFDVHGIDWLVMPQEVTQYWRFAVDTAFRTPGNDPDRLIWRCRPMMIAVGAMLAVLIGRWSRQVGGGAAAIIAMTLYCLDPTFLAHSSLVTNDVPVTFALTLATYSVWRLGNRFTLWRVLLLAVACGLCLNTKLSGILIVPLVVVLLLLRVLMPASWTVLGSACRTRTRKGVAALAAIGCCAATSYVITWASYGFRYAALADDSQSLNVQRQVDELAKRELQLEHPDRPVTAAERSAWHQPASVSAILDLMDHHVMPEGWLFGVLFSLQNTQSHPSFLLGSRRDTGWWYYFPLVILFKTPTATLAAIAVAGAVILWQASKRSNGCRVLWQQHGWIAACLGLPLLLYLIAAMRTPMDIGIRYILPLYPWMFVATGAVAASAWRRRPRLAAGAGAVLAVALTAEVSLAFPNYLAFFNVIAGGPRAGIRLLGDSNLDWGQDLFALCDWQATHPAADLHLCYFGIADPNFYGLHYTPMPGGYPFDRAPQQWPTHRCTVAISATYLQGLYMTPVLRAQYAELFRPLKPTAVLDGSIYLFEVSPTEK